MLTPSLSFEVPLGRWKSCQQRAHQIPYPHHSTAASLVHARSHQHPRYNHCHRAVQCLTDFDRTDCRPSCLVGPLLRHHPPSVYIAGLVGPFDPARLCRLLQRRRLRQGRQAAGMFLSQRFLYSARLISNQTGQALILAPSGLFYHTPRASKKDKESDKPVAVPEPHVAHIGRRYIIVKTRKRVTADGGASLLAVGS